jgi:RES domain-containing protein
VRLYRIAHRNYADPFNGDGARIHGGRWNPKGIPMLYYGTTKALSALEKRVHIKAAALAIIWRLIEIEVPTHLVVMVDPATLPADWFVDPAPDSSQVFGRRWVAQATSLGLGVPSTIIQTEFNVVLNPLHPDMAKAKHVGTEDFRFDRRLAD